MTTGSVHENDCPRIHGPVRSVRRRPGPDLATDLAGPAGAGGLAYLSAGIDYHLTPWFSLQGTINYHVDSAQARNGEVRFERYPIELVAYYQPDPAWRLGGGARYVTSPKLTGSGLAAGTDVSFANTTSALVEAEYFIDRDLGFKLRYVHETYKARGVREVDGSHAGMSINFYV